ncbi:phage holin family protein [Mangrovibacter phragmitis]|uniref:phage holin family protein n=1 Tax=Mangrovibacter phragmitis TaxID=1691903 RepID=UPI0035137F91
MQNYTPPDGWGALIQFLQHNRLAIQSSLTAFSIALLFCLRDGAGWRAAFNSGFICGFVALGVTSLLEQFGVSDIDWSFVVGVAVGGVGADRCRAIINAAVTLVTNKKGISNDK